MKMKKQYNILIVEDDPDIGGLIRMILEHNGYNALVLANTQRVIETIKNNRIDLVILDMLLSGANGTDICAAIRNDDSLDSIPLLMMSAHPDAETICKTAGADDFVSKPFDLDDLLFKIAHFVGDKTFSA